MVQKYKICSYKDLKVYAYSSITHKSPKLENNQSVSTG